MIKINNPKNYFHFTNKELSILHRAMKVYHLNLLEESLISDLDYKDELISVTKKIKKAYEL